MLLIPLIQADLRQASAIIVPKRFRYDYSKRPLNRRYVRLMQITLPRFKDQRNKFVKRKTEELSEKEKIYRPKVVKNGRVLHGLDVFLHNEISEIFSTHPMLCGCLRAEMPTMDMFYKVQYELRQNEMDIKIYPGRLIQFTIQNSPHSEMKPLFPSMCAILFGKPNCKKMLSILKQNQYLMLLGGLVDGKYMSTKEIENYAQLPSLDETRVKLSAQLTSLVSSTHDLLRNPSASLTASLHQHANSLSENNK